MQTKTQISILALLLIATMSFAQTQQGFVKTIGRPNKPGVFLPNVVIQAQGRVTPVISDSLGEFHIPIPGKMDGDSLVLTRIQKSGYELLNMDATGHQFVCSSKAPIIISMVDLKQLATDKKRIEDNAYRVAEENYQKKRQHLQAQLDSTSISIEKYRHELVSLEERYENYLLLIGDMANRYARTDFDNLDSIDYQISLCIENGELFKADSLIHTRINPETVVAQNHAAKQEIMDRIDLNQSVIDKSNADLDAIMQDIEYAKLIAKESEKLAQKHLLLGENEEALNCLEKSLDIKTTLYGLDSEEVKAIYDQINKIKP